MLGRLDTPESYGLQGCKSSLRFGAARIVADSIRVNQSNQCHPWSIWRKRIDRG